MQGRSSPWLWGMLGSHPMMISSGASRAKRGRIADVELDDAVTFVFGRRASLCTRPRMLVTNIVELVRLVDSVNMVSVISLPVGAARWLRKAVLVSNFSPYSSTEVNARTI